MLLTRARILTATLLLVSAGAFAAGVALERGATSAESTSATIASSPAEPASTAQGPAATTTGDGDGGQEGAATSTQPSSADGAVSEASKAPAVAGESGAESGTESGAVHAAQGSSESLLGVNPESTSLVVAAVLLSVLLAVLVLTVGSPLVAVAITATMVAFTALDVREIAHQLNESRPGLASLAAVVALLHLLAAVAAFSVIRGSVSRREVKAHA
ncbi:hypothetical protein [Kineosporia sp. R_H_3]|uniref:hypothetical protein n=1 Tax=Kineosporia sp. R_H_3 TaxID=1961848 RepID=UPI00117B0403|nr:hypothetical protein [Kineosporia sp. R_H_3]